MEKQNKEQNEIFEGFKNVLTIGDISLGSKTATLTELKNLSREILNDRKIEKYLSINFPTKKTMGLA